jgi:hypothetical protein
MTGGPTSPSWMCSLRARLLGHGGARHPRLRLRRLSLVRPTSGDSDWVILTNVISTAGALA